MIEQHEEGSFNIKLSESARIRAAFHMCWFWKHGNYNYPDLPEQEMRDFVRSYDEECRLKNEADDVARAAAKAVEPASEAAPELHIPVGLPSLGGLLLSTKLPKLVPEPESDDGTGTESSGATPRPARRRSESGGRGLSLPELRQRPERCRHE